MTRKTNLWSILILLMILLGWNTSAFCSQSYYYRNYQSKDGLSHNMVLCSLQDSDGFIWLGTNNGLNRFDGRENVSFFNLKTQQPYLDSNVIHCLAEDSSNRIWVGTNRGLYTYQKGVGMLPFDKTTKYLVSISSEVHEILMVDDKTVWIATLGQGIFIYHLDTQELEQLNQHTTFISDLLYDGTYVYVVSMPSGIICFKPDGTYQKSIQLFENGKQGFDQVPNSMLQFRDDIWITLNSASLIRMDKNKQIHYYNFPNAKFKIIHSLLVLDDDTILLGTDSGLFTFNSLTEQISPLDIYDELGKRVVHNINGMMRDREGGIWVLTKMSGVDYIMPQTKPFQYVDLPGCGTIYAFCKDEASNILWIGTQNGLYQYDTINRTVQIYPLEGKKTYDIRTLFMDGDQLWIGTFAEGLKVLNTSTGEVRSYRHSLDVPYKRFSRHLMEFFMSARLGDYAIMFPKMIISEPYSNLVSCSQ